MPNPTSVSATRCFLFAGLFACTGLLCLAVASSLAIAQPPTQPAEPPLESPEVGRARDCESVA
jgi:hypothetical protein